MPKEKITWESLAIDLAKYHYKDTGRLIRTTPETIERLKNEGYFEELSKYLKPPKL